MAKSSSFFGLRRGSTKSLTFQVNQGKQITKDRVQVVRNPRTEKQMYQRAIMATVMAAYSGMKSICDHSFQGKNGKAANQQEFMRLNLNYLRNDLVAGVYSPVVVAPKISVVQPNLWHISRGSYPSQKCFTLDVDGLRLPYILDLVGTNPTPAQIGEALGISPGTQITFCFINQASGNPVYQMDGRGNEGAIFPFEFKYGRLVFKKSWPETAIIPSGQSIDDKVTDTYAKFFTAVLDDQKTDAPAYIEFTDFTDATYDDDHVPTFSNAEVPLRGMGYDQSASIVGGIITSEEDGPGRDNSQMFVLNDVGVFGISSSLLLEAWENGVTLGESEKYLEGGK